MIKAGAGEAPADVVIKNVRLLDVITGSVTHTDIAIVGDRIVGTYGYYNGLRLIQGDGRFAVPGFIDTHLHIESSLVTPHEFDRCVLPYGVTTAICDPHEIANVLGVEGLRFFLDSAMETIMDIRVQLFSCVPATNLETAGADLPIEKLLPFRGHPKVIGLAEFMNFPGVIHKDLCPENLVIDPRGIVHAVDNEWMTIGPTAFDLARTWYRWPMPEPAWRHYLSTYACLHDPEPALAHFTFWRIAVVSKSARVRVTLRTGGADVPLRRLAWLAAEA